MTRRYWCSPGSSSRTVRHSSLGPLRRRTPSRVHCVKSPVMTTSLAPFARTTNGTSREVDCDALLRSSLVDSMFSSPSQNATHKHTDSSGWTRSLGSQRPADGNGDRRRYGGGNGGNPSLPCRPFTRSFGTGLYETKPAPTLCEIGDPFPLRSVDRKDLPRARQ